MSNPTRRMFLATSGAALAASRFASAQTPPSERVRHAVIGLGGQGRYHARQFNQHPACDVVAICDLDPERRGLGHKDLGNAADVVVTDDFRRVLDDPGIDSVSIATPDHWHTPLALHALLAGKNVYVEKPCSHNVYEGKLLAETAAETGLCVQHGTQGRSSEGFTNGVEFLRSGELGEVRLAKAINHQLREPIGRAPAEDPPAGFDYDRWCGPAPLEPFTRNRYHYNWHWYWDLGTGDIGNDGIHQIDEARWGLGVGLPNAVTAPGGQLFYDDDHQTPDTQIATFEYDDAYLVFEMRLWTDYKLEGHDNGVVFYGDNGILEMGRAGCSVTFKDGATKDLGPGTDFDAHVDNFVSAVKANAPDRLNAPILEGATSASLCHLGNVATRVGHRIVFDPDTWTCPDDAEANALMSRTYREGYELPVT